MEPISAIALSLALGAGAIAGKEVVSGLVKDAYAALKDRIKQHYPKVSVEQLEEAPQSKSRRAVVEEDLANAGAATDSELADAANRLIELVRTQAPGAAAAIGVDLKDVEAANLRLRDIAALGYGGKGRERPVQRRHRHHGRARRRRRGTTRRRRRRWPYADRRTSARISGRNVHAPHQASEVHRALGPAATSPSAMSGSAIPMTSCSRPWKPGGCFGQPNWPGCSAGRLSCSRSGSSRPRGWISSRP